MHTFHRDTPAAHQPTQTLKAALFDAVAAISTAQPDSAPALWDRLLAASVVGVAPAGSTVPVIRYDLAYQLNEIQARSEDYQEVLSFVRLLNALWGAAKHPPPDAGRAYAHFSRFVREDVLGTLAQRAFRDPKQRWELATACLTHLKRALDVWAAQGAIVQHGQRAPGLDVLLDMLGTFLEMRDRTLLMCYAGEASSPSMRALLWITSCGPEQLALERREGRAGAAHEEAVVAALGLLHAALQQDQQAVMLLRQEDALGMWSTMVDRWFLTPMVDQCFNQGTYALTTTAHRHVCSTGCRPRPACHPAAAAGVCELHAQPGPAAVGAPGCALTGPPRPCCGRRAAGTGPWCVWKLSMSPCGSCP